VPIPFLSLRRKGQNGGEEGANREGAAGASGGNEARQPSGTRVYALVSSKGGCGKSTLTVNMAMLASAVYGSALIVDMDFANATATSLAMLGHEARIEESDISIIDALYQVVEYRNPNPSIGYPKVRQYVGRELDNYTIPVGDGSAGLPVGEVYLIPAKLPRDPEYPEKLSRLSNVTKQEAELLAIFYQQLYNKVMALAKKENIPVVFFDLPPFERISIIKADVTRILEFKPQVIAVSIENQEVVHGVIGTLIARYPYIVHDSLASLVVNMARGAQDLKVIVSYVTKNTQLTGDRVVAIPDSALWRKAFVNHIPPILLEERADRGAARALIEAAAAAGVIPHEKAEKIITGAGVRA